MVRIAGAVLAGVLLMTSAASADEVALVKDGKPVVTVVLPEVTELDRYLSPTPEAVTAYLQARFPNSPEEVIESARQKLPAFREKEAKRVGDEEELAIEELLLFVERISGAKLPVVRPAEGVALPAGPKLFLGTELARKAGLGADLEKLHRDGFVIRAKGADLVLSGRRARGTLYAVYELLESFGCRWVMPGPAGDIIPTAKNLSFAGEKTENPSHDKRYWWATLGHGKEFPRWTLRNKGDLIGALGDSRIAQGHALSGALKWGAKTDLGIKYRKMVRSWRDAKGKKFLDENGKPERRMVEKDAWKLPDEYHALHKGKPSHHTPNMSNPKVWDLYARYYINIFSKRSLFADYTSISAEDGLVLDSRKESQALLAGDYDWTMGKTSSTDLLWFFHNRCIERVMKVFPNRKYGVLVYANNMMPPRVQKIHPNMALIMAPLGICPNHHVRDPKCKTNREYRKWFVAWMGHAQAVGAESYYYDYDPLGYQWNDFMICPQWPIIAKNYPWFYENGLDGHTTQGHDSWGSAGINHWLMIRLYWNAEKDPEEILEEYRRIRFGKAAPAVAEYMHILEARMDEIPDMCSNEVWDNHYILTPEVRTRCRTALARAEKLVEGEREKAQLDMLLAIQKTTDIFCGAIEHARETGDFKGAVKQLEAAFAVRDKMNKEVYSFFFHPKRTDPAQKRFYMAGGWNKKYVIFSKRIADSAAHVILPRTMKLELDTDYRSLAGKWYLPETDVSGLKDGDTTLIPDVIYQTQREPAAFFYRTEVKVPRKFKGKKAVLYFPSLIARKMQIWINGREVQFDHGEYKDSIWNGPEYFWFNYNHQQSYDLGDLLKPGRKNTIAFRVFKSYDHGGSYDRIFLLADPPTKE